MNLKSTKCKSTYLVPLPPLVAPTALRQTADDNKDKYGYQVAETVQRNFYVDDLLQVCSDH